jgi:hypothetical protein
MQIAQVSHYKMNTSSFCKTMSCDLGEEHFSALLLEYFHHAVRSEIKKKNVYIFHGFVITSISNTLVLINTNSLPPDVYGHVRREKWNK